MVDGKVLRGTRSDNTKTVQLLAALDEQAGEVRQTARVAVNTTEGETALELLKHLILHDNTFAGGAAFVQCEICDAILEQKGPYLFLAKDTPPNFHKESIHPFMIPEGSFCDFNGVPDATR